MELSTKPRLKSFPHKPPSLVSALVGLFAVIGLLGKAAQAAPACGFPARSSSAWNSSAFYARYDQPSMARELAVIQQALAGNIPTQSRLFKTIVLRAGTGDQAAQVSIPVAIDYFSLGTDQDFVRAPITNVAAQYLAGQFGLALPTVALVDLIYGQADAQLVPQPTNWYENGNDMRLGPNYVVFNKTIEAQRNGRPGLVAGHKKDVVLTNLLDQWPGRVAIYGWQEPGNRPIQPLGTPHDIAYEDYSHGTRFIGPTVTAFWPASGKTKTMPVALALVDPTIGPLLNGGSRLNDARAARQCPSGFAAALGLPPGQACPPQPVPCF